MLPFKYKSRKVEEIIFRNAGTQNTRFFIKVHPSMQSVLFQSAAGGEEESEEDDTLGKVFQSLPTEDAGLVSVDSQVLLINLCLESIFLFRQHQRPQVREGI